MNRFATACIATTFVAVACGGSQEASGQSSVPLCCAQPTSDFSLAGSCSWGACVLSGDPTAPVYIQLAAKSRTGHAKVAINGSAPLLGLCFGNVPDWCIQVDTSPDLALDTSSPPTVYVPQSATLPNDYEYCYPHTPASCAGRVDYGSQCCDATTAIPMHGQFGQWTTLGPTATFPVVPQAAAAFVPAMPGGWSLGMGAALLGLGLVAGRRR